MKQNTPVKDIIEMIDDMISDRKERGESTIDLRILRNRCTVKLEQEKQMVVDAYFEGFKKSAEGYNYEYPFSDNGQLDQQIKNDIGCDQYYTTKYNQLK